jgi:hypothetical protein
MQFVASLSILLDPDPDELNQYGIQEDPNRKRGRGGERGCSLFKLDQRNGKRTCLELRRELPYGMEVTVIPRYSLALCKQKQLKIISFL